MGTKRDKLPIKGGMRVRTYDVLREAVEKGINYGWNRAHKHTDEPDVDSIKVQILLGVANSICEYFSFTDEED